MYRLSKVLTTALLVLFAFFGAYGQGTEKSESEAKMTEQQVKDLMQRWVMMQATWNDIHTPKGARFEMVPTKQEKNSDGSTKQFFEFHVSGVPADGPYKIEYWPIGSRIFFTAFEGATVNAKGVAICGDPKKLCAARTKLNDELGVGLSSRQGEPQRFVLSSKNGKVMVTGMAVPFPAAGDDGACQIEIFRLSPQGELMLVQGRGFAPHTELTLTSHSGDETQTVKVRTSDEGLFFQASAPFTVGKESGTLTYSVEGGAPCHPSASIGWGPASDNYL